MERGDRMKEFCVCFKRRGKCTQRVFDNLQKAIKYIERYIGSIKDYRFLPNFYVNADLITLEIENEHPVKIFTPLGEAQKIEETL